MLSLAPVRPCRITSTGMPSISFLFESKYFEYTGTWSRVMVPPSLSTTTLSLVNGTYGTGSIRLPYRVWKKANGR